MVLELILQRLASCQHFPLYGLGLGFEVLFVFRNVLTFSKSINILLQMAFAIVVISVLILLMKALLRKIRLARFRELSLLPVHCVTW